LSKLARKRVIVAVLLTLPALIVLGALFIRPLLDIVWLSLCEKNLLRPTFGTRFVGLENFTWLLKQSAFRDGIYRSLIFTISVSIISISLSMVAALLMNFEFRGGKIAFALILLPWITSIITTSFIFKWLYNDRYGVINFLLVDIFHLLDHPVIWLGDHKTVMPAVMVVNVWKFLPFSMLVLTAALKQVSQNL